MASEVTTTSANDLVYSAWILATNILPNFYAFNNAEFLVRTESLAGIPSKAHDFPTLPALTASSLTEGTDATNTAFATGKATVTAGEVGIMTTYTDVLSTSSIGSVQSILAVEMGKAVAAKMTTDILALATGFSSSVGTTTVNITEANAMAAVTTLMIANAPGPYNGILYPQQWEDLAGSIGSTLTPAAVGGPGARVASNDLAQPSVDGGLGNLYGVNWNVSAAVPTANAGADSAGMVVSPNYAIGKVIKWNTRVEMERDASLRGTEIVVTANYGVGELKDAAGVGVITDR